MKKYKTEEQLGDIFIKILKILGYEIWCEVESRAGIIDIVALKDNQYYTFHLKLNLSNKVIEQAYKCHIYNTKNYVVVPQKKTRSIGYVQEEFLRNHNIGVMSVYYFNISEFDNKNLNGLKEWNFFHRVKSTETVDCSKNIDISTILFPSQKNDKAGIKGGGYDTAFKRSMNKIIEYHTNNNYISLQDTWDRLGNELHWKSKYSFFSAISTLTKLDIVRKARSLMMDKK